ncbi:unnamed protein product [Agarophyton chilense]
MLEENGPLLNTSQLLPERVIGELVRYAKSSTLLETNLLNGYLSRFATGMLLGGVRQGIKPTDNHTTSSSSTEEIRDELDPKNSTEESDVEEYDESESDSCLKGSSNMYSLRAAGWGDESMWIFAVPRGNSVTGEVPKQLVDCVEKFLSLDYNLLHIVSVHSYQRAITKDEHNGFAIEVLSHYQKRDAKQSRKGFMARQRHWIAANYASELESEVIETYYGSVLDIYEVEFYVEHATTRAKKNACFKLVRIQWQNGLRVSRKYETVSTKLGSNVRKRKILDTYKTFEQISSVDRKIGYFDHGGQRYFLFELQRSVFEDSTVRIQGSC